MTRSHDSVLDALVEHSRDPLVLLDRDFRFVRVNRAYAEECRRGPLELVGKDLFDLFPHTEHRSLLERVRDTGEPAFWHEEPFHIPDQPERGITYWDGRATAIRGDSGEVEGLVLSLRDVTETVFARRHIAESEQRFRTVLEHSPDVIYRRDIVSDRFAYVSPAVQKVTGYSVEEFAALSIDAFLALVHPEDAPKIRERIEADPPEKSHIEYRFQCRDGTYRHIAAHRVPTADDAGRLRFIDGSLRDVTEQRSAEEALNRSELRLSNILESLPDGFAKVDQNWNYSYVNSAAERMFGRSRETLLGKNIRCLYPESEAEQFARRIELAHSRKQDCVFESYQRPLESWIEVRVCPASDGFSLFLRDVTDRRRAEESLRERVEELQTLLDVMPALVFITDDPQCGRMLGNRQVNELLGIDAGTNLLRIGAGAGELRFFKPDGTEYEPHETPMVQAMSRGQSVRGAEMDVRLPNGRSLWMMGSAAPLMRSDGKTVRGAVAAVVDVSELKQAERALREADSGKTEFLAVLSHELRNPLAPIKNSLYILSRAEPRSAQACRAREVIARQVDQLCRLVDDLLDVTRISRNKIQLRLQRLDFNDLVRKTVEDHATLFQTRGIVLKLVPSPVAVFVTGDSNRLAQAIGNVLQNSAKFTSQGGCTSVYVGAENGFASVRVADTGVGMSEATLSSIFKPFVQGRPTLDRSTGGLGLGLALVKGLIELHQGEVKALSPGLGHGAELLIRLPLCASERPVAHHRQRVLIVDHDSDSANSLREALELGERDVAVAHSGTDGLVAARAFRPDVVLCKLTPSSAQELACALKSESTLEGALFVGIGDTHECAVASTVGFAPHFSRPPTIHQIEQLLSSIRH